MVARPDRKAGEAAGTAPSPAGRGSSIRERKGGGNWSERPKRAENAAWRGSGRPMAPFSHDIETKNV
jgi:hypothetical protein